MWRLAVDMGVGSLGWVAFSLNEKGEAKTLLDGGVRIFPDGREAKTGEPLNVRRREQRGIRRNRDRRAMRDRAVISALVKAGLLESYDEGFRDINPYKARHDAAQEAVDRLTLARALFHLSRSRGFKSNRKTDGKEDTKFKKKIVALREKLGDRTLGQWLWQHHKDAFENAQQAKQYGGDGVDYYQRAPLRFKADSEIYPERAMIENEFDRIRQEQENNHELSPDDWALIKERIFFQRSLKPQERGRCKLYINEYRALKALYSSQKYRIENELSNLKVLLPDGKERFLIPEEVQEIRTLLDKQASVKFTKLHVLKDKNKDSYFPAGIRFNLEASKDKLEGNKSLRALENALGAEKVAAMSDDGKDALIEILVETSDAQELEGQLEQRGYNTAQRTALMEAKFEQGTMNLSTKAMKQLIPHMMAGIGYHDAVKELKDDNGQSLHHSLLYKDAGSYKQLPYYGEILRSSVIGGDSKRDPLKEPEKHFGKITNTSVHTALNQLRRLVNALIKRYGVPHSVHLELARELPLGAQERRKIQKRMEDNRKWNEKRREFYKQDFKIENLSRRDLQKIKLWEELNMNDSADRRCVFTGDRINCAMLFSGEVEIEHILPFSRTLDDGLANKTLAFKRANHLKGNRTPYEAFADNPEGYDWERILMRAKNLPQNKFWRFGENAMQRFDEHEGGFIARSLNDTKYMARTARTYLEALTGPVKGTRGVTVVTGRHTSNLRHDWGLNSLLTGKGEQKNRDDQRHHMLDAFVIGLTTRSVVKKTADDSRYKDDKLKRGIEPLPDNLRAELQALMDRVIISYKPDHSANGQFYDETAYGKHPEREGMDPERIYTTRKAASALSISDVEGICDPYIQKCLKEHVQEWPEDKKSQKKAREDFLTNILPNIVKDREIKRLRVRIKDSSVKTIPSAPYKGYARAGYAFVDIWEIPPKKKGGEPKYLGNYVDIPTAKAILEGRIPAQRLDEGLDHPAARRLMRLFKDDMVSYVENGERKICKVFGFSASDNRLDIRDHIAPGQKQIPKSLTTLCSKGLHRISVSVDGHMKGGNR